MSTMSTEAEILPEIDTELSDFDDLGHYARIKELLKGGVQVALCGKKWIPRTIAKASDYPVCPKCSELMGFLEMMDNV